METGSVVKWNKKVGDKFEAGDSICEIETDKATVSYEATDAGYLAKILKESGEVKVGQPLMITVEEPEHLAAFKDYVLGGGASSAAGTASSPKAPSIPVPAVASTVAPSTSVSNASPPAAVHSGRVVASPYAKVVAKQSGVDLFSVGGSGPNGRIIASDVIAAASKVVAHKPSAAVEATPASAPAPVKTSSAVSAAAPAHIGSTDFSLSPIAEALASLFATSKRTVPHYHLSVELNLTKAQKLLDTFNSGSKETPITMQDVFVKAAGAAMKTVPVANASWMDSFVRCYDQVKQFIG